VGDPQSLPGAPRADVTIDFEGREIRVSSQDPVGVALLRQGEWVLSRSIKYHLPRGLFCLAQECAGCLMRIDGEPNQYSCTTPCAEGMRVSRQNAFPSAGRDVWRAIDWAYPSGLNHHEMFAGVPVAETVMAKVARQLAGYGVLPDSARPIPAVEVRKTEVCVIGAGKAGGAALEALASHGVPSLAIDLVERAGHHGASPAEKREVVGIYRDELGFVVAARADSGLSLVRPKTLLICAGSRDQTLPFAGNDRPGVFTGKALAALIRRHRLLPGARILIAGEGPSADDARTAAREAGAEVRVLEPGVTLVRARGTRRLAGAELRRSDGTTEVWTGEAMAACGPRSPCFELGAQAGADTAAHRGGFAIAVDARGATSVPGVFAAGSCSNGAGSSEDQGRRAAEAIMQVRGAHSGAQAP
jgi:sarcosine oxidase subunit alpha